MANRMKTSSLIYIVTCTLLAMSETGAEREFKPSLDKSGMADTDLFRVKRASLPVEKIWSKPTVTIDDNGVSVCKRYQCTYNSFVNLNRTFPGLFPTVDEFQRQTGLPVMSADKCVKNVSTLAQPLTDRSSREAPFTKTMCVTGTGDGDDCCPTYKGVVKYTDNSSVRERTNVNGQLCYTYQLFTLGTCRNHPTNNCGDQCTQETNLIQLYAYNYVTEYPGFNIFHIESYCSCKALKHP